MNKSQLVLFTIIMSIIGFLCRFLDQSITDFNSQSLGLLVWLISPFILMLVFRAINKDWKSFGIKPYFKKMWKWYVISLLIYPIIIVSILVVGKIANTIDFTNAFSFSVWLGSAFFSFIPLFFKNIFEEFTWRGYLTTQFEKVGMSRFKNHLFVGMIWALWHLPFLDLMIRSYSQMSFWVAMPLLFVGIIVTAFIYGEIRLRSTTVWTAVLLHAAGNSITNPLFNLHMIKLVPGKEFIAAPTIDNLTYIFLMLLLAAVLFRMKLKTSSNPKYQKE